LDITDQNRILESVKESITETTQKTEESASYFIIGLSGAIVIAVLVLLAAVSGKKAQIASYDQQIQSDVTDQLKGLSVEQDQISSVFTQLDVLETSLLRRVKYSGVFSDLAKNQYQKSKWTSVTVKDNIVSITGEANNFEDVAKTVVAYKSLASVTDAKLTSANLNQERQVVSFVIDLTFDLKGYNNPIVPKSTTSALQEGQPL